MKPVDATDAEGGPTLAELMDSVALERRLAEARARRAVALARRATDGAAHRPAMKVPDRRVPLLLGYLAAARARLPVGGTAALGGRPSIFAAGLAAGLAAAGLVALVSGHAPSPPNVWHEVTAMSVPAMAERPAVVVPLARVRVERPGPLALAAAAPAESLGSLRPEPRPARAGPPPQPARLATRSARNRPAAAAPPEVVVDIIGGLNLATIGRAAATLGVRERVVLPGVTLSLAVALGPPLGQGRYAGGCWPSRMIEQLPRRPGGRKGNLDHDVGVRDRAGPSPFESPTATRWVTLCPSDFSRRTAIGSRGACGLDASRADPR